MESRSDSSRHQTFTCGELSHSDSTPKSSRAIGRKEILGSVESVMSLLEEISLAAAAVMLAAEVLAECVLLALIVRVQRVSVSQVRGLEHPLETQLADLLPMIDGKRHVMRAHLESGAAAGDPVRSRIIAETRVEEAGVVGSQLPAGGVIGGHLGRVLGRDAHAVLREEEVELLGVQDDPIARLRVNFLPEIVRCVAGRLTQVNEQAIFLGPVTHHRPLLVIAGAQSLAQMQPQEEAVACGYLIRANRRAVPE